MKLIFEADSALDRDYEYIKEAAEDGNKKYYVKGVFMQAEIKNRNGRVYPKTILEKEVARYVKEHVEQGNAYGELGHPQGPTINGPLISHRIVELKEDGNNFVGKARVITDTPNGAIVKALLEDGGKIGMSSRGMGSLKPMKEGNVVQDDFYLATAGDIVIDPSAPEAFVEGIMEGVDWVMNAGTWVPRYREEATKTIDESALLLDTDAKMAKRIAVFEGFISNL